MVIFGGDGKGNKGGGEGDGKSDGGESSKSGGGGGKTRSEPLFDLASQKPEV
jgi:hypothetical protein